MFIGVEIGGTKLQIGVGTGDGVLAGDVVRLKVDPANGAEGIRSQLPDGVRRGTCRTCETWGDHRRFHGEHLDGAGAF